MSVPQSKLTYQDYLKLPEDQRYEVLEGDLYMVPAPGMLHQEILANLYVALRTYVLERKLGKVYFAPVDVILDDHTIVQPDLLVILNENMTIKRPEGVRGAPNLVVEVLSPGTSHRDRGRKRQLYGRFGVREYWLLDPQGRTLEVAVLRDGELQTVSVASSGDRVHSPLFPDLCIALDDLFA